jgi:hypothetical protein
MKAGPNKLNSKSILEYLIISYWCLRILATASTSTSLKEKGVNVVAEYESSNALILFRQPSGV